MQRQRKGEKEHGEQRDMTVATCKYVAIIAPCIKHTRKINFRDLLCRMLRILAPLCQLTAFVLSRRGQWSTIYEALTSSFAAPASRVLLEASDDDG